MKPSRRDCLKLALLAGVAPVAGCAVVGQRVSSAEAVPPLIATTEEERLLNRCGFGPSSKTVTDYRSLGKKAYLKRELEGNQSEDLALLVQLQGLDVFQLSTSDLWDLPSERVLSELQQAAILYAVYGRNQLRERMVDFWTNHFNIYARKGNTGYAKGTQESKIIRKHALESFPEMLKAMARSPAMLEFLDQEHNLKGVPNENYARELMELHTLGLQGGYTQKDVQEVARCFTGWTIEHRFLHPRGEFRFDPDSHDDGPKTVLGHSIPAGGGEHDAEIVLDLLANHPSTARFISTKMCLYLLGSAPTKWVSSLTSSYQSSSGNIATMLSLLLHSQDILDSSPILKRPFDLLVTALRATDADTNGAPSLQRHLEQMGEPLYQWPMPDGYPVKPAAWTSSMLPRWNFATSLCAAEIEGTRVRAKEGFQTLALKLASPEFQWR